MSDSLILGVSSLGATILTTAISGYLALQMAKLKASTATAAAKVDALGTTTAAVDAKLADVVAKVEEVRHATNSLTDRLVASTAAEALARGGVEERARADERRKQK